MKFFNKIRFRMLKGKKLSNYLVYAIGEIILVVIGILIAVWINNWNKDKQIASSNRILQEKVLAQLDRDITEIDKFTMELDTLNQVYLKILKRDYDKTKVNADKIITTILFEVKDLGLSKQNINWIDNSALDDSPGSEMLVSFSEVYKLYFKNINDIETIIYNKITSNLEYLETSKPWYTDLITDFSCKDECLDYLLNDPEHGAKIASLRLLYIIHYDDLVRGFASDLNRARLKLNQSLHN